MSINLEHLDDSYEDAVVEDDKTDFEPVPDGNYTVKVHSVELRESQAGNPMLSWQLIITGPSYAGRYVFKNSMLMEKSLSWFKKDLAVCGMKLTKLSDLGNKLEDLLDIGLDVTVKTNGEWQNVYFNSQASEGSAGVPENDVPF